jgi:hypothetical protein
MREVREDAGSFELLALAADRAHIHSRGFADPVVAFPRIPDQMPKDQPLLII